MTSKNLWLLLDAAIRTVVCIHRHNWNWPGADRHLLSLIDTVALQLSPDPRQPFFVTVWDLLFVCPSQPQPASLALDAGLPSCQRLCVRLGIFCSDPFSRAHSKPFSNWVVVVPTPLSTLVRSNSKLSINVSWSAAGPGCSLHHTRTPRNPYLERWRPLI